MGNEVSVEEEIEANRDKVADDIQDLKMKKGELERDEKKLTAELLKIPRTKILEIRAKARLIATNQIMQETTLKAILELHATDQHFQNMGIHNRMVDSMDSTNNMYDKMNLRTDSKSVKKLHTEFRRNVHTMTNNQNNIASTLTQGLEGLEENTDDLVRKILDMHNIKIDIESPQIPQQHQQQQVPQDNRVPIAVAAPPVTMNLLGDLPSPTPSFQDRLNNLKQ